MLLLFNKSEKLAGRYALFVFFALSAVVNEKQSKTIQKVLPLDVVYVCRALRKVKSADNC